MSESLESITFIVDMEPVGRRSEITSGATLLDAARSAGVGLISLCGGEGWCESCLVRLMRGQLSPPSLLEEAELEPKAIDKGYRLACQAYPLSDVKIEIPPTSLSTPQRLQLEGQEQIVALKPTVTAVDVICPPPSLQDLRSDATRLKSALETAGQPAIQIGLGALAELSPRMRQNNWKGRLVLWNRHLVTILPPNSLICGLAADIGTTKLALYLVDLENGQTVEKAGTMNPQIAYGEDVMSRISYANEHPGGGHSLQSVLIDAFNELIDEMCQRHGISPDQIVEAVCVGNTAMHHLFAGLPVKQLGLSPCVPAVSEGLDLIAADVGLRLAHDAPIHLLPNIAGYVGADHVAMLLATKLWQRQGTAIGVDIGTNTEISLVHQGELFSCSAASGPAFEGAHIHNGMRAAAGAIERLQIIDGAVHVFTIDNLAPVGICGSGILDTIAEMYAAGVIDEKGAFQTEHDLVRPGVKLPEFLLVPAEHTGHGKDITITRQDVNEVQLAKAAIRVGIDTLLEQAAVMEQDIEEFLIAGAFGSYINISSAVKIGMFPDLPLERFHQVGNAAGIGAQQSLISTTQRRMAEEIAPQVTYVELTGHPDFQRRFLQRMYLD
jgi:uncharacterized 2Fe-2S/4Fe-4S cluster protein (DUF4445 family)